MLLFLMEYRFVCFYSPFACLLTAEYPANAGVHHLTEEECNGCGVGVRG